jgi:ABC-type uncharacterized transport system auxiliary subunit
MRVELRRSGRGVALAVALAFLSGGCLSGSAPADRFYRLDVPTPKDRSESPRLPGRLLVDAIRGDSLTLERLMLYRDLADPTRVRRDGYDHWVEPPPAMVERALVEYLRARNLAEAVVTPEMHVAADYRLSGRVHRFERLVGEGPPRVSVELEFHLVRLGASELLLLQSYGEEQEVSGSEGGDSALAFSGALGRIFERLAADLPQL